MRVEQTDTFRKWLDGLEDRAGRARVLVRIDRLIGGNPGQHRQLAGGVSELKIDVGPGYRVYYALRGSTLLLLLAGGDKSTQQKDIAAATRLAQKFSECDDESPCKLQHHEDDTDKIHWQLLAAESTGRPLPVPAHILVEIRASSYP